MVEQASRPTEHKHKHEHEHHTVGALVKQASEEFSDLVRKELQLALAEMTAKGRRVSRGGALFGAAAVLAFVGFEALVAAGIVALGRELAYWAAALAAGGALVLAAGLCAAAGRRQARKAAPMRPEEAISGVRTDVETIRERAVHHDKHPQRAGQAARAGVDGA